MKKYLIIGMLLWTCTAWSQCFLDSTKVRGKNNLIEQEEATSAYYCVTRPMKRGESLPDDLALKVKQYLIAHLGPLYKKLKFKSALITDWSLLENIVSTEPSKGKCSHIDYVLTYALVFEGWIEYELCIPVTKKGKVVDKGYYIPELALGDQLPFASYCKAFDVLAATIRDDIGRLQEIYVQYNQEKKGFEWVFVQEKEKVLTQKNVNGLPLEYPEYHYSIWKIDFEKGSFEAKYIIEKD